MKNNVALPLIVLFCFVVPTFGQEPDHGSDDGSGDVVSLVQNGITNAIAKLEKRIPREQQLQILAEARIQAQSLKGENRTKAIADVANEYLRLRFPDEARQLYTEVLETSDSPDLTIDVKRALSDIAFVADNNIGMAIEHAEDALVVAQMHDLDLKFADLLIKTGSLYFIDEQPKKMKDCFDQFLELPDEIKKEFPRENLKANLYIGRALRDENDSGAAEYFAAIAPIIKSSPEAFELDLVLSIEIEKHPRSKPWNAPDRIEQLVKIFDHEEYEDEPGICDVGNQIFWAYFLETDHELERFDDFTRRYLKKLDSFFENRETLEPHSFSNIAQIASQTIGAYAYTGDKYRLKFNKEELAEKLNGWMQSEKRLTGKFPIGISRDNISDFVVAIRDGVVNVLECNINRPDEDAPPTRVPTPIENEALDNVPDGSKQTDKNPGEDDG